MASFRGLCSSAQATSERLYADGLEIFVMTISWKDTQTVMRYDPDLHHDPVGRVSSPKKEFPCGFSVRSFIFLYLSISSDICLFIEE
jgi:hypothetical protein